MIYTYWVCYAYNYNAPCYANSIHETNHPIRGEAGIKLITDWAREERGVKDVCIISITLLSKRFSWKQFINWFKNN